MVRLKTNKERPGREREVEGESTQVRDQVREQIRERLPGSEMSRDQTEAHGVSEARDLVRRTENPGIGAGIAPGATTRRPIGRTRREPDIEITPEMQAAYEARNAELARTYPSMEVILRDPDAYVTDIRGRFERQKERTPETPYEFDFSDYGMPAVRDMQGMVSRKLEEQQGKLAEAETQLPGLTGKARTEMEAQIADRRISVEYLGALKSELDIRVEEGTINYRHTQELGYFVSRALGLMDFQEMPWVDRKLLPIDRGMQGHVSISIREDFDLYRARRFSVFQGPSNVAGFQRMEQRFEEAFFDKNQMNFVYLPTGLDLGKDIFKRMAMHDIYLGGIAEAPIAADGFRRPGYDFWLHDIRHASIIWGKRTAYEEANGMTEAQKEALRKQVDVWMIEMERAMERIPDPELRSSIEFFNFNHFHERGVLPVPSSFRNEVPALFSSVREPLYMANINMRFKTLSGQAPDFKAGQDVGGLRGFGNLARAAVTSGPTFKRAYQWLQDFWLPKIGREEAIIGGPVVNPSMPGKAMPGVPTVPLTGEVQ